MKQLTSYPKTLKDINEHLDKLYNGKIKLTKGSGYFYVYSDDEETGLFLSNLFTTSIYTYKLSLSTIGEWIDAVKNILNNPNNS